MATSALLRALRAALAAGHVATGEFFFFSGDMGCSFAIVDEREVGGCVKNRSFSSALGADLLVLVCCAVFTDAEPNAI